MVFLLLVLRFRELHVARTQMTDDGLKRLSALMPQCHIEEHRSSLIRNLVANIRYLASKNYKYLGNIYKAINIR